MDVLQHHNQAETKNENRQDASYFRRLHKESVHNLQESCSKWMNMKAKTEDIPESVIGEIDSVTGQAQLLVSQKLSQFESLIDAHEFDRGDKPTNLTDIHGFWDMIHFQIEDIDRKVANLESMSQNGWTRIEVTKTPNLKTSQKRVLKPSPSLAKSVSNRSRSTVRRHIREAQKQLARTPRNDDVSYDSRSRSRSPVKPPIFSLAKFVESSNKRQTTDQDS